MANTVQLTKNGQPVFPVTDVSLVMGLQTEINSALARKQDVIQSVQVTVDNNTGTPSASGSVSGSTLSLDFHNLKGDTGATGPQGPQGPQGNTGSSVDYPFELANNLTTDDPRVALSAAQGVVLGQKIDKLSERVGALTAAQCSEDGILFVDDNLNIGAKITTDGFFAINLINY
jgi:hypothetical protein